MKRAPQAYPIVALSQGYLGFHSSFQKAPVPYLQNKICCTWSYKLLPEPAAEANARLGGRPPYELESWLVHFNTRVGIESRFVRVHGPNNQARNWMVKRSEIAGLTPVEIRDKLNLRDIPSHISDVFVPGNTPTSRGMTHFNQWEEWLGTGQKVQGQVQYRIEMDRVP